MKLSELRDLYPHTPAAVLGGGPSMPADLKQLPRTCIKIAVNYHAHVVGIKPEFMVYLDDPRIRPQMLRVLKDEHVVKVSPEYGSDVEMDVKYWRGNNSATTAAWLALWMGCDPVYLCGMNLYMDDVKYCHTDYTPDQVPTMNTSDLMRPWIEECRGSVPHPERLVAVSGPLQKLFPPKNNIKR
jgi:hypothetical protein